MDINIGGKQRPVKYTVNALLEFEELTGIQILGSVDPTEFGRLKNMRALAFVGLKHGAKAEQKEIDFKIEDVGDWIGFNDGSMGQFLSAFQDSTKSEKEPSNDEVEKK